MQTTILFIRHGEVENPRGIFYGRLPRFRLSALGRKQAAAAAAVLATPAASAVARWLSALGPPQAIFCSPMLRTRQTAQIIANQFPHLTRHISQQLNEVYSPYEGSPISLAESRDWEVYAGIPANYEQPEDVLARILKFTTALPRKFPGECVLVVTHGDPIFFLTLWAMGRKFISKKGQNFYPAPASITSFIFEGDGSGKPEYHYYHPQVN